MLKSFKPNLSRTLSRFKQDTEGAAAVEFTFIFPVILILFYGTAEFFNFNLQKRRANMAIEYGIEMMTRDDDNNMSETERHNALDLWVVTNPTGADGRLQRGSSGYSRTFSSARFVKFPPGCVDPLCSYVPDKQWIFYYDYLSRTSSPMRIACESEIVDDGTSFSPTGIPEGMLGRTAIVMGAYTYRYQPLLNMGVLPSQDITVSAIRKTRNEDALVHDNNTGTVQQCNNDTSTPRLAQMLNGR